MITPSWQPHVHDRDTGTVDRAGYTCCVLDQLRTRLRRRDIYARGSTRWGDPRAELLTPQTWADQRETLCDALALEPEPVTVIGQLSAALDAAWRRTATGYAANPDLRIEHRKGRAAGHLDRETGVRHLRTSCGCGPVPARRRGPVRGTTRISPPPPGVNTKREKIFM